MATQQSDSISIDELSGPERRFVEEYLRDPRPKAAAIKAGYSERSAAPTAWRLLHRPRVAAAIRAGQRDRTARLRISVDRIVLEHARLALSDMGRIVQLTRKGPRLRAPAEITADESAAVREVIRRKGGFHLKLYDKAKSLHVLTEMLGVVKRFQAEDAATDAAAAQEREARYLETRDAFLSMVARMRDRLGLDPEASAMDQLAEGVARGDEEARWLAEKLGNGPTPRPPKPPNPAGRS